MVFSFTNHAAIPPQESPFSGIIGKILGGYSDLTKARYLKPSLEEELQKARNYNKYYGPNMESQIGLRGAQTNEAGARTGLLGEQTRGAHLTNQYLPEKMRAQIDQLRAQAEQARVVQMIRQQMLGGGLGNQQQQQPQQMQSNPSMPMGGGQGMPSPQQMAQMQQQEQPMQQSMQQPQEQNQPQQNPMRGMDYSKAATIMQMLGLGKPHVVNANGKFVAITPFGNIDTGVSGLNARDTALAKKDAEKISDLEKQALSGYQKQTTFDELNKDLGSPEFEAMRQHPELGRHELAWFEKFGKTPQQQMIGRMRTHVGNIIKDSSRDFAGQFRIGEQALLNSMKPNESDSLGTMKGKAEALTFMNQLLTRRAELEASLMRDHNMPALKAKIAADKQIDPSEIKKEIRTILNTSSSKKNNFSQEDLEFTARKHGMSVDEVRQKLEAR